jgi:hypothetical protein
VSGNGPLKQVRATLGFIMFLVCVNGFQLIIEFTMLAKMTTREIAIQIGNVICGNASSA